MNRFRALFVAAGAAALITHRPLRPSPMLLLRLVSSNGVRVPALDSGNNECTVGGLYSINQAAKRWRSVDTTATPSCSSRPQQITVDSGDLRVRGDTLAFYRSDSRRGLLLTQRGVFHRDTLHAGALLFDEPPLIYARVP